MPRRWLGAVLLLLILFSGHAYASPKTGHAALEVEIGDHGAIVQLSLAGGRAAEAPRSEPNEGFAEWFGVSFKGASGRIERVGLGVVPDWAGRRPVESLRFSASERAASAIARAGDLEIRTEFELDLLGPHLRFEVTLTNRGDLTLDEVVYTREWRQPPGSGWMLHDAAPGGPHAPDDLNRRTWRLGDLSPGASAVVEFDYARMNPPFQGSGEVPLSLWTDAAYPEGLPVGATNGVSWGDYDADGFIDILAGQSGNLWRNVNGTTWELYELHSLLPPEMTRYGVSFGDYNNDGLPDIGTEPRGGVGPGGGTVGRDVHLHLLKNLGGDANFADVSADASIVDFRPFGASETLCWGDVNADGNLDLFLPVYPPAHNGPGNFFLLNLGPDAPDDAYRFTEMSLPVGLDNPPGRARPEGAQFADVDFDGDMDLYSNGTLYQNVSTHGGVRFEAMTESASGIGLSDEVDEGAMFFDYDLDGDYDLFVAYALEGIRIWESYGDGMFFSRGAIVDKPLLGAGLGLSAEDWDNDGDIDFTTRNVFRRNRLVEDGQRHFTVALHSIPAEHVASATPAWGDWDRDGDLDCALGNWSDVGHFYENTLYSPDTPDERRRNLRVRVVGNSPSVPQGVENEHAASVEVHLLNGPDTFKRKKFVASSHGYLNQNEYTLSFGLPEDPLPDDPDEDLRFDLTVDFPSLPVDGPWRVDKHVNPVLGNVDLADLGEREIRVYRCGEVVVDGVLHEPPPLASARLTTTTGGLALPTATLPLAEPTEASPADLYVGLSFNTLDAADRIRVKEVVLDGELNEPVACGSAAFNLVFWDVTDAQNPFIVAGGAITESSSPSNHRSRFRTDVVLDPGREYRLVARVKAYRATAMQAPVDHGPIEVTGGLSYEDSEPCGGQAVAAAQESATDAFLALRFSADGVAAEQFDPVRDGLRLGKDGSSAVLQWPDLPAAAGYEVLRCSAAGGPCVPTTHATTEGSYVDENTTDGHVWYKIQAVRSCSR